MRSITKPGKLVFTTVAPVELETSSYFVFEFNAPPLCIEQLLDEYGRDVDVMRKRIFKKNMPKNVECTLHEELLPPPYRKDVQELVAKAKRHEKPKFRYNADLDYYPFQK